MKIISFILFVVLSTSAFAETNSNSFTPEELVKLALSGNPELHFYNQQVASLPKASSAKAPLVPQPLDFPSRASFRRAVLNLDSSLARLYLDEFRFALAGEVRLKAMEYEAASESAATARDLATRISALVQMLEERPAAGIEALIERRILEGASLPFVRQAAEANVRKQLLRMELNGLIGRNADEPLSISGSILLPPEIAAGEKASATLIMKIREAEVARGLAGLEAASEVEAFSIEGWFTREGLGTHESIEETTRPGPTGGSTVDETKMRLLEDARTKLERETVQRQIAVTAASEVATAISSKIVENLRAGSDLAERQYRVGALGVNLLIEAHREYLDALQSRNEAVIQAWRNRLDLEWLSLPANSKGG